MIRAVVSCPDKAALGKLKITIAISATLEEWQTFKKLVEGIVNWPSGDFVRIMQKAIQKYEGVIMEDMDVES
jgi:hypothetical protein